MTRTRLGLFLLWVVLVTVAVTGRLDPVYGTTITATADATKFGHLDQAATSCPLVGCGATSAVNSFVYLQNLYPGVYTTPLVPKAGATATQAEMAAVANDLAQRMGTRPSGTSIEDFILGKMAYLEAKNKGRTKYGAQLTLEWDSIAPKPGFVNDKTPPALSFIAAEIKAGEDVEAFLAGPAGRHFITLTGISYDDQTNTGTLSFVDPLGGKDTTVNITGVDANKLIHIQYTFEGVLEDFVIASVVTESPVPEPSVVVLLGSALVGLVSVGLRRKGTPHARPICASAARARTPAGRASWPRSSK
jgi:PEP-CTERM motif